MVEEIMTYLEYASSAIGLFAVAVIVVGFVLSSGRYVLEFRELITCGNMKNRQMRKLGSHDYEKSKIINAVIVRSGYDWLNSRCSICCECS